MTPSDDPDLNALLEAAVDFRTAVSALEDGTRVELELLRAAIQLLSAGVNLYEEPDELDDRPIPIRDNDRVDQRVKELEGSLIDAHRSLIVQLGPDAGEALRRRLAYVALQVVDIDDALARVGAPADPDVLRRALDIDAWTIRVLFWTETGHQIVELLGLLLPVVSPEPSHHLLAPP